MDLVVEKCNPINNNLKMDIEKHEKIHPVNTDPIVHTRNGY